MTENITAIIDENKNLIYSISHYFKNYPNKEDLFQVGCIGVINAYKNFNNNLGVKFTTYAYPYILGEMKRYVNYDRGIKISRKILSLNLRIEKAKALLTQKLMREPTIEEVANFLNVSEDLIIQSLNSILTINSFDEPITASDGKDLNLYDVVSSIDNLDYDSLIMLKKELNKLNECDKNIIKMRYFDDLTQTETANILGINQVQVSRKEQKILQKLRTELIN